MSLEKQGYTVESIGRTFLGRIRLHASLGSQRREIVIDRTTGEILRDYTTTLKFPGSDGVAENSVDDDDDDDDDDDGDDDDGSDGDDD